MATISLTLSITLLMLLPIKTSSVSESEALMNFKKSLSDATKLVSWVHGSEPCGIKNSWDGIVCYKGIVTDLRLGDMGLSGKIDIDALIPIPFLRTISIVRNSFSGPIPDFNRLGALKAIYISSNQFSGDIPADYFSKMESLKKVWFSDNKFTGEIPVSLTTLPHLIELHLENNQFTGAIPFINNPTLSSLNFSNNKLVGPIPSTLSKFNTTAFLGNDGLCGETLQKQCENSDTVEKSKPSDEHQQKENTKIATAIMTSGAVLLSLALIAIVLLRRRGDESFNMLEKDDEIQVHVTGSSFKKNVPEPMKASSGRKSSIGDLVMVNDEKGVFGLPDLMKAAAEVLGNGGLGSAYKAMMSNGVTVVVKRMRDMNRLGRDGFDAEMRHLGRLRHRNIITPLAYHYRRDEKLLVSEFVPRGSLLYLLHGDHGHSPGDLDWHTRLKIIHGIANGLLYLHNELISSELPHGNLKSSNVLITSNNEPLLSEYGYYTLINPNQLPQISFAYKSPEAAKHNQVSPKCDIYCLGIIILEVLTGKFPSQYATKEKGGTDVVQWVMSAISEDRELDLLDPEMVNNATNRIKEMEKLLHIGASCAESDPARRLDLREVVRLIEEVVQSSVKQDGRTIQLLPSLRDGYADSTLSSSQTHRVASSREDHGDGFGHSNGGSFNFPIS